MRGIFTVLLVNCAIFAVSEFSYSQSNLQSTSQNYSGTVKTFSNEPAMINRSPESRFAINSNFNESTEKGRYYVYFSYFSNFGKISKGKYSVRILKHVGNRMKEMCYDVDFKGEESNFSDILVLKKGVYSIRVYDENKVLLGHSDYFNVIGSESDNEYAKN